MGVALGFGGTAGASHLTVTSLEGSAFGVEAGGLVEIERTPFVQIGPGSGSASDETLSAEAADLLGVDVFPVETTGETGPNGFVTSSAQVANVQIGDLTDDTDGGLLDLGGIVDDLLGGGGTLGLGSLFDDLFGGTLSADVIRSECESRLGFPDAPDTPGSRGETEIVGLEVLGAPVDDDGALLNLDDNPLILALEDALDIDLGVLRVVVNEQQENTDANSTEITVNALRLTILGDADTTDAETVDDDALLDVIIAQSHCELNFTAAATTTTSPTTTSTTTTTVAGPDNDADNDADLSNDSDGTAVIETGDATAVGNISNTEINQTANAPGGSVDQDATVINEGSANANTGGNVAIGNNSVNIVTNRQRAAALDLGTTTTGTIPGANHASNTSSASNTSNGTAAIQTGDADAVGNISNTEVNQTADATGGTSGFFGGGVDQDAAVANIGDANANTGGNTAIGNNSANFAGNRQTAVAVGDDGAVDPCCPQPEGANIAGNTSTAANTSDGTAAISTGDAAAVGNVSETAIDQNAAVTGSAPCGGTCPPPPCGGTCEPPPCGECPQPCPEPEPECPGQCPDPEPECPQECPDHNPCEPQPCGGTCGNPWTHGFGWSSVSQSATVVNSGSASANTGGNTAIGNNSTNVVNNRQTAVAADDD